MLTVVAWNMNQRLQAWQRLRNLTRKNGASLALLQEARWPGKVEDDWRIHPPVGDTERWRIAVPRFYLAADGSQKPTRRYWASAVAATGRAISDLSVVFQDPEADLILVAGDFNLYNYPVGDADRSQTVWSRLAAYGLEICGPFRPGDEPRLARCPCPDRACRHVNTYLCGSDPKNRPYQLDFFLATPLLRERLIGCWADPDPDWMAHSDHRAIFATFDL